MLNSSNEVTLKSLNNNIYNDTDYKSYQKELFHSSSFKEILLDGVDKNDKPVSCLITIEKKNDFKKLNFYNNPIDLDILNLNEQSYKKIILDIKKICFDESINSVLFKKNIKETDIASLSKNQKNKIDFIGVESTIKLTQDLKIIVKDFSKGHRSSLKINYEKLDYEIFDFKNYRIGQIYEMMKLHEEVSGKVTRSKKTWQINENMILNKKGFLIKVKEENRTISYAFFFYNNDAAIYFSSCTLRETFKLYKNITHKIILKSIEYLRSVNCKNFFLGTTKSIFSNNKIDIKNKNIELFKSSFGGKKNFFVIYNNILNF